MQIDPAILGHAVPFALVLFRLAGLFVMAPLLTSVVVPMRHKALLAMMLAAATYPVVLTRVAIPAAADLPALVPMLLAEAMIGLVVGALASLPLLCVEMSGVIAGHTMGFGLARVYNPEADLDADVLGQLLMYIATGVFIAAGGLEQLFAGVLRSFDRVPLGTFASGKAPLDLFVGVLGSGLELALRVAAPVVGICLLLIVALGVVGKTLPALNIMTVGFTIKLVVGILIVVLALHAIRDAVGEHVGGALAQVRGWIDSLTPAAGAR